MMAWNSALVVVLFGLVPLTNAQLKPANNGGQELCREEVVPSEVQNTLKNKYGSWKIQNSADLAPFARKRWQQEKTLECPGIAIGHFENRNSLSYALLLIPLSLTQPGYRFLVFSRGTEEPHYSLRVIEESDQATAKSYFIRKNPISKFFDEPSRKKFRAQEADGILLGDAAENEYEVDIYWWNGLSYQHSFVDY